MPRRALSVCPEPGCPELVEHGRCARHAAPAWESSRRSSELPRDWKRRRLRILRRDEWTCVKCGDAATEVDHIGDRNDHRDDNLQSLCTPCHRTKTLAEAADARRRKQQGGG